MSAVRRALLVLLMLGWGAFGMAQAQTPRAAPGIPGWTPVGKGCFVWNQSPSADETATWSGGCKGQLASGTGTLIWRAGTVEQRYDGGMEDGRMNGRGVYLLPDGTRYEGEFKDDDFNGSGVLVEPAGRYEGMWRNGQKNGRGVLTTAAGDRMEGEFKDDALEGPVTLVLADGRKFDGIIRNGKPNGPGTLIDPTGSYTGEWVEGCFSDGSRRAAFATDPASCK